MQRVVLVFLMVIFFTSCGNEVKVPEEFPDKYELACVLTDLYLLEATFNSSTVTAEMRISKNYSKYYRDVLVKHNLTKDKFDTIISWYTAHPKLYLEVYDDVISMLSEKEAEESNLIEKKDTLKELDSVTKQMQVHAKDLLDKGLKREGCFFDFSVDSTIGGVYVLCVKFDVEDLKAIEDRDVQVFVRYSSGVDTIKKSLVSLLANDSVKLQLEAQKDQELYGLSGEIFRMEKKDSLQVEYGEVALTYIP